MNNYFKHLEQFAKATEITRSEMKEIVLTKNEPFKIYTRKLDGTRMVREMFSVDGPSGNVNYDYADPPYDYMILYDLDRDGYRTIVFDNVYKITKFGKTYIII
jgi:hypothetical protein